MFPTSLDPPSLYPPTLYPGAGDLVTLPPAGGFVGVYPGSIFGPSLFPVSLFPGTEAGPQEPTPDLPYDLAGAIVALFNATPGLSGAGGFTKIYRDQAGDRAVLPYLVVKEIQTITTNNSGAKGYYETTHLRFSCFASTGLAALQLGEVVRSTYHKATLAFEGGYLMSLLFTGGISVGAAVGRTVGGGYVYHRIETFRAKVGRSL